MARRNVLWTYKEKKQEGCNCMSRYLKERKNNGSSPWRMPWEGCHMPALAQRQGTWGCQMCLWHTRIFWCPSLQLASKGCAWHHPTHNSSSDTPCGHLDFIPLFLIFFRSFLSKTNFNKKNNFKIIF